MDKVRNPETNKLILVDGPTYRKLLAIGKYTRNQDNTLTLKSPIKPKSPVNQDNTLTLKSPIKPKSPINQDNTLTLKSPIKPKSPINQDNTLTLKSPIKPKSPVNLDFLSKIKKIEGPISYVYLTPTAKLKKIFPNPPSILLFGDVHIGDKRCKSCDVNEGCYSFYNYNDVISFLKLLNEQHNLTIDAFFEYWVPKKQREKLFKSKSQKHNSAMVDIVMSVIPCFSKGVLPCKYPNLRSHMADIRKSKKDDKYLGDSLLDIFNDMVIKSDNAELFLKYLKEVYPNETIDYIFDVIKRFFKNYSIEDYVKDPFYQKYGRVYHEYKQIPEELKEKLVNIFDFEFKLPKLKISGFIDLLLEETKEGKYISYPDINSRIIEFQTRLVDLYTISRILKTAKYEKPSNLSIVYLGEFHTQNIRKILTQLKLYNIKSEYIPVPFKEFKIDYNAYVSLINLPRCIDFKS
jgi:hypothetical protein